MATNASSSMTASEHHLKRQLRLRDLVLSQVLTVVGSAWVGIGPAWETRSSWCG